ncbi:hypothetical protein [Granulicella arctica]|uniref:hypothetical protein n=1 Tax=Granulicella arctica TaxID=940613 RepID=UPI0021E07464|nr:hypothetical protein [Granulicella arctica]
MYSNSPALDGDPKKIDAWFATQRATLADLDGVARAQGADQQILQIYAETMNYMSSVQTYLARLNMIKQTSDNQSPWDVIASIITGVQTSTKVEDTSKRWLSSENASSAGTLAGFADGILTYQQKSGARAASDAVAMQEEARKLEDENRQTASSLRTRAARLTAKYGWSNGEAAFDGFTSPDLSDMVARSPRDPFLQARYADALYSRAKTGNDVVPAINAYWNAARLVPDDAAFYPLRNTYLRQAINAAIHAANLDSGNTFARKSYFAGSATRLSRTYISLVSPDNGYGQYKLATALGYAGRYSDAIEAAHKAYDLSHGAWENSVDFCVVYASLMSLSGDEQEAANWILKAYTRHYRDIKTLKTNDDFAPLRNRLPQRFEQITSPKVVWHLRFDTHPASIVIQNNSDFDLVRPKLLVRVRQGNQVIEKQVGCDLIEAGHSCQVDNAISVPGDRDDAEEASLISNQ